MPLSAWQHSKNLALQNQKNFWSEGQTDIPTRITGKSKAKGEENANRKNKYAKRKEPPVQKDPTRLRSPRAC